VARLDEFYQVIRHRPDAAGTADDFFDFYSMSPGSLLPPKWFGLIEALPAPFRTEVGGQAVWQWIGLVLVVGMASLLVFKARRLTRSVMKGGTGEAPSLAAST